MSGARYRRGLARVRRRCRALAPREPVDVLRELRLVRVRGALRCVDCGGRVLRWYAWNGPPVRLVEPIPYRKLHGRECIPVIGTPPSVRVPFVSYSDSSSSPKPSS